MTFPKMIDIIPEAELGDYRVEHFKISDEEARLWSTLAGYKRDYLGRMLQPGEFCRLMYKDRVLMSDTHAERNTNYEVVQESHGDVLIAGLGLGMIICSIAEKESVNTITVVEISEEVIKLVEPSLQKHLGELSSKLTIVNADIFEYKPTQKFNVIYFDIWGDISGDEYPDTKKLHRKFSRSLDRTGEHYIDCWVRWYMKDLYFGKW